GTPPAPWETPLMKRRDFLVASGSVLPALAITRAMANNGHVHTNHGEPTAGRRGPQGYMPVHTPNGWTLPHRMVDGVKEFHLVAEEIEHEFAPGSRARCWGYNGTSPGPTLEAVEGDRVRIFVTNRLPEHTSIHWHGLIL